MQKFYTLHSLKNRIFATFLAISFIFSALVVRLFVIQIINGKSLQSKATDQWTRDLSIVAPRGDIYDSNGARLAVSYTNYNIFTRPREISSPAEVAKALSQVLDLDFSSVYQKVSKKGVSEVLIKMGVDGEKAEEIYALGLNGVYLAENVGRYYTYGNLLTQVLGFTSVDNVGQAGLEAYFDEELKGEDGCSFVQSDLQGKEIGGSLRYYLPATKGGDMTLTVDSKLQILLEQTLEKLMIEQKPKSVSAVVLNPKTCQVLAMSTKPSFDLNEVPRDNLDALFEQSKMKLATDIYEPGSTFKILTVAAALEEGVTSLEDRFYCPGYRVIDGIKIKCWKTIGHGSQNLVEAFGNSCNCCFMDLALRLGVDKFYKYLNLFGLGKTTGLTVKGEAKGILMDKSSVKRVDLARMGFGHAVALTPLQLSVAVSSVVNGGSLLTPYIVEKITGQDNNLIKKGEKTQKNATISQKTSNLVNYLLQKAENKVKDFSFVEGYNVGGKTGTAQKYKESGGINSGKYISSFVGTYPANNPQYVLLLLVDEASAGAYYGSIVAAPYGKEFFSKMFELYDIEKDDKDAINEIVEMPNLVGLSLTEAAVKVKELGLFFELDGDGEFVTSQLPMVGSKIEVGSQILLICNQTL